MFREDSAAQASKLKERTLLHKRIANLVELQKVYTLGEVLGKGNFGTVVKASDKESKNDWAIKIINKQQAGASRVILVEREIHILKLVDHPNIIFLASVFESPKTIYLVFELCTGSLAKELEVKKRFEEPETMTVIRSLTGALAYLHKNDIVHRDLKLENILIAANPQDLDDKLHIKVTDFGLSAMRVGPGHENMLHDCCGTLTYMAPEMIATKSYSQQCDVWSMGIIMYVLLFGKLPFYSGDEHQLCRLIKNADVDLSGLSCSPEAIHLLNKMLEKNPAFRITAAEVEHHPWISQGNQTRLHAHSSNVLDMMRMWRDEMMEPPKENCIDATSPKAIPNSETKAEIEIRRTISKLSLHSVTESPYSKQRFWMNSRASTGSQSDKEPVSKVSLADEESEKSIQTNSTVDTQDSTSTGVASVLKQPEEKPRISDRRKIVSRLPDFSHVPAKVDSNLANLRKGARRKRTLMNTRCSAPQPSSQQHSSN